MFRFISMIIFLGLGTVVFAQDSTLVGTLDYQLIPASKEVGSTSQLQVALNVPVDLGNLKLAFTPGLRHYNFDYWDNAPFDFTLFEQVNNAFVSMTAGYSFNSNLKLQTTAEASWASGINADEMVVTGSSSLIYKWGLVNPARLRLGLQYDSPLGNLSLLPLIEIAFQTSKFKVNLGFPNSQISYPLSAAGTLSTSFSFTGDYFYIPKEVALNGYTMTKAGLSRQQLGLDYTYRVDDSWGFSLGGGYLFTNDLRLYESQSDTDYKLNMGAGPIFSAGIKFNFPK
ncbi:hypothetical protein [Leeuwenhoekiella sp. H156]|uniref:hypothetical protein n=1 Tax=Leeuwenhoekiella sp. H156 TaxID=3450128 RepID=UPI003FA467C1